MKDMLRIGLGALALAGGGLAVAQQQAPLALDGPGPFYRLVVPAAIHGLVPDGDLRDVRVRNAAGQAVPFAWLDAADDPQARPRTESHEVALLPLPTRADKGTDLLGLTLRPDGTLALAAASAALSSAPAQGWVIDSRRVDGALVRLRFELAGDAQGIFPFTLEASDDLRQWQPLVADDQLVRLQRDGQSVERLAIDLGRARASFLRLSWRDGVQAPALARAWVDSVRTAAPTSPALEWTPAVAPSRCGPDFCDYPAPPGLPLQRLRIHLADRNTMAPVQVSGLSPAGPPAAARGHRHALDALRRGDARDRAAAPAGEPQAQRLADTVVYRLDQGGGEVQSAPVALDDAAHAVVRLQTRGPMAALGTRPPTVSFAARPRVLEFLAQGQPPFVLGWQPAGQDAAADSANAAALKTLREGIAAQPPGRATVSLPAPPSPVAASPAAAPERAAATATAAAQRSPWLWAALGAGLLVLGAMAWSLLHSLSRPSGDT
ncbi:DUF3999 family protein [uncultured Pseudacidovorax sp.]|uniref:DUF3999 family protein n=1 Tax=uncultured Pseudacidovorax sp. TaxID=679313 RepID=UPI0025E51457|nr:DUF3999 family protein [uncultured Pseudacidovorax sp.]